jgi:hypothetical protein
VTLTERRVSKGAPIDPNYFERHPEIQPAYEVVLKATPSPAKRSLGVTLPRRNTTSAWISQARDASKMLSVPFGLPCG